MTKRASARLFRPPTSASDASAPSVRRPDPANGESAHSQRPPPRSARRPPPPQTLANSKLQTSNSKGEILAPLEFGVWRLALSGSFFGHSIISRVSSEQHRKSAPASVRCFVLT